MAEPCDQPIVVQRSLKLDLVAPEDKRHAVIASIRRYRHACRQLFAVVGLGQLAAARLTERDGPDGELDLRFEAQSDQAKIALAAAIAAAKIDKGEKVRGEGQAYQVRIGSGFAYELRDYFLRELYPSALSFVWDSARRDVTTAWTARDPQFPKAGRGWLALQGARGLASFMRRGIGMPRASARPKLVGHQLILKWDRDLESVAFRVGKLDGSRYVIWKRLRDYAEGWKLGTLYLTENRGRIAAVLTYEAPGEKAGFQEGTFCDVLMTDEGEQLFYLKSTAGRFSFDEIDAAAVLGFLAQHQAKKIAIEQRIAAAGNPRRPWGHRRGWRHDQEVRAGLTRLRMLTFRDYLHAWSRRIVTRATDWLCQGIRLAPLPLQLRGHDWPRTEFLSILKYKCAAKGLSFVEMQHLPAEEETDDVLA